MKLSRLQLDCGTLLENFTGFTPVDYTTAFKDSEYEKYRTDLKSSLQELKRQRAI